MANRNAQDYLSSGEITEMYIGGVSSGDEVLTSDEIVSLIGSINSPTTVNAATYTVQSADRKLHVTYTTTGACTITIPTSLITSSFNIVIKDGGGNAGTNNITIATEGSETIDGSASLTISTNYDKVSLYSDDSNLYTY